MYAVLPVDRLTLPGKPAKRAGTAAVWQSQHISAYLLLLAVTLSPPNSTPTAMLLLPAAYT